ncbi:hypothetical protein K443DRAFT_671762 [Laccaria amethystina LaAM-08-1]|uniref:P-loop containing nucleoside triphosphate hydrolase protein n=1 Tax=Laccaria amethystina LaAM-08-1 TaxID=1095629 RepID=A0A0C9XAG2_9AGAR|nr:hypothetical protein K443DRAFT_671762 [Laccaria amethystina LaAM-08-1]
MEAVQLICKHILAHRTTVPKPLFVALQGPQGSGKSYLSGLVQQTLSASPNNLRIVVISIDDLYLPHGDLISLASSHPNNPLWQGRGQPGTHDVDLGIRVLNALKQGISVEIPRFDKSLFNGDGDRLLMDGSGAIVSQPPLVDTVILEGWCVGFRPIPSVDLDRRWNGIWKEEREKLSLTEEKVGKKIDVENLNDKLKRYAPLWTFFDTFVQLKATPPPSTSESQYSIIYEWRLEQERYMKEQNGGRGMSDAAVKSYAIPFYQLSSCGTSHPRPDL